MAKKSGVAPESRSLPQGGGAITSIGDSFRPNLSMGGGTYKVPLDLPPGPGGFSTKLDLFYHTGMGSGPFGFGWTVTIPYIESRRPRPGRTDEAAPRYSFFGSEDLIQVGDGRFMPRSGSDYQEFRFNGDSWTSSDLNLVEMAFGGTSDSRMEFDRNGKMVVLRWYANEIAFRGGGNVRFLYEEHGGQIYPKRILWSVYRLEFEYENRPDPFAVFLMGNRILTARRCRRMALHNESLGEHTLMRSWSLDYETGIHGTHSFLKSVTLSGHRFKNAAVESTTLPPLEFGYTDFDPASVSIQSFTSSVSPPPGLDDDCTVFDYRGNGLPGILRINGQSASYWPNIGRLRWGPMERLYGVSPRMRIGDDRVLFADLTGSGTCDLIDADPAAPGYYANDPDKGFLPKRTLALTPSFALDDPESRLIDLNGDGIVDLLAFRNRSALCFFNDRGKEWSPPHVYSMDEFPLLSLSDPRVRFADMTGTGRPDLVMLYSRRIVYHPFDPETGWGPAQIMDRSPDIDAASNGSRIFMFDVTGDGCADLVQVGAGETTIWLNRGGLSFSEPIVIQRTPALSGHRVLIADMTGSGTAGLLWSREGASSAPHPYYHLDLWGAGKPYLMNRITNNRGIITTIVYETSVQQRSRDNDQGDPWKTYLPFPVHVVKEIANSDTVAGTVQRTEYRYHDGRYDWIERRYLGFGRVESIEYGDESEDGIYKLFHFHNRELNAPGAVQVPRGEPCRTETAALSAPHEVLELETIAHETIAFPGAHAGEQAVLTLEAGKKAERYYRGARYQSETTQKTYNDKGLLTRQTRQGAWMDGNGAEHEEVLVTEYAYAVDETGRSTALQSAKRKLDGTGQLLGLELIYYDGEPFVGLPLGTLSAGLRTRVEEAVLGPDQISDAFGGAVPEMLASLFTERKDTAYGRLFLRQKERLKRDARGLVVESLNASSAKTKIRYDSDGLYPRTITIDEAHTQEVLFDPVAEQIARNMDVNGNVTITDYDALGNIVSLSRPGALEGMPTETYSYRFDTVPNVVEKRIRLNADDVEPTWVQYEYKDGHQREYQRRTLAENGKWAVGAQQRFNSKGRKAGEHDAYFSDSHEFEADPPGGVASCRWSYDAFGRMIREVHYNGGVSLIKFEGPVTSYYSPLISGLLDDAPDTKPTRRIFRDAWNRAVEITEYGAHEQVTYFHNYDPLDRIASIVHGPTGIQTHRYVYDLTGRSIRIRSVDAGTKTIIRDALFNEVMTTDADNRVLYKEYDPRGRVTKTRKDGPAGEVLTTFDYDGNETDNVIGRLRRVTAAWGGAEYVYTHDGKVARVIRTFAGHTPAYTVEYGYNSQGNPTFVRYPDGTLLDYAYNAAGLLESISGVIDNIDYNATGKRVRIAYANGVETAFEYTDGDYMINEIRTINAASATAYQHLVYHLDAAGQVSAIEDRATVAGKVRNNQSFTYDLRHQLVRATGQGAAGAYDYRYEYDLFGNMTRNDEAEGDAIRYGLQEGILAHPNRMVRRIGDGADFDYDQSGNLIKTPELSEIQYCSRHRPIMIERSDGTVVEYVYDHDGRRIRTTVTKDGVSHVEYNVENLFYIQGATTTKVVFDLNKKAAILPSAGDGILFHIDRQGNNNILTNLSTGAYIGQNEYTPYGRLSVSMVIMPNFSFQQSEFSVDVQMVLLGARHYLPRQGRFLVPDAYLLQNPEKLKMFLIGYNLYTYGNNNPINYIDPSGNFVFLLAGVLTVLAYVLIAAVVVGAVAGIISAAVNGAQTWDEWLLSIVAGIVGAILVTLVGFWIGGVPGAIVALSIFMIASWIGAPLTRALDETDSEVAWFFSFLIKWIQSPVLTTIGLFVVLGYAIAGHDVDLERGALFVNVGGSSGGALTLGAIVYANGGNFDAGGDVNDDLARHEAYHTRQVAAFGEMGFYLTYIILGTIWGAGEAGEPFGTDLRGCGNPFEKTARTYNHPEASPTPTPTGQC